MGGKGELSEQKIRATQDQLRLARLTQDLSVTDDDRAQIQKLVKKVVETTRCTISQAEIALYDSNNDVEEAVNAILENVYADDNVWTEQKSRRTKRAEAEERAEELQSSQKTSNRGGTKNAGASGGQRKGGFGRGRGTSTSGGERGSYRGSRGGSSSRGSRSGRGNYHQSYQQHSGISSANNVWDNSQAYKSNGEWAKMGDTSVIEEIAEDTEWKKAGTLVFSRRDEPVMQPIAASSGSNVISTPTSNVSAPISFAAVVASANNKAREKSTLTINDASTIATNHMTASGKVSSSSGQPQPDNISAHYQNATIVASSGSQQQSKSSVSVDADKVHPNESNQRSASSSVHHQCMPNGNAPNSGTVAPANSGGSVITRNIGATGGSDGAGPNATAVDWTARLKNDLGIGEKNPNQKCSTVQSQQSVSNTVEFVSGDANAPSLPEYQFGFHVDTNTSANDDQNNDVYAANAKTRPLNSQAKVTAGGSNVSIPASSPANSMQHRQPVTSGLSYADTSSMSYPASDVRTAVNAKMPPSLHQQQPSHPLYTTTQPLYSNYPYMNMYSPVAGVRQDEYGALVQYPFVSGLGQIDMNSLPTMIPPAALASQQAQNQPPPPVQSQHQQRPDQHTNYVDLTKAYLQAYATAVAVNSTVASGVGSGLLGGQQQRDLSAVSNSAVAPPPGFSGPPSNLPTAAFALPQHNHINSLFQVPPYHPQMPFSFMMSNAQPKLNHQLYTPQTVEDSLNEQRLSSQQQKAYTGGHHHHQQQGQQQQIEKYGSSGAAKERLSNNAQATPPPSQVYQTNAQNYINQQQQQQQMPSMHHKKAYGGPQHWSAS